MRRFFKDNGLTLILFSLFALSILGHRFAGCRVVLAVAAPHDHTGADQREIGQGERTPTHAATGGVSASGPPS